ncbi:hypothetical protein GG344DRAFT_58187, partial [Lentinula edodes]
NFKKAYSETKIISPKAAIEKILNEKLKFDDAWGSNSEDARYSFQEHVKVGDKDVTFFDPASKIMIQTDLLFNLPRTERVCIQ